MPFFYVLCIIKMIILGGDRVSSLKNMNRSIVQLDELKNITELYKFKGKDFFYQDILKRDLNLIMKENIEHECYAIYKLMDLNISDSRLRGIVKKDAIPKTSDETIMANIKSVLNVLNQRANGFELETNQFLFIGQEIFKNVKKIEFKKVDAKENVNILTFNKKVSKREVLTSYLEEYKRHLNNGIYENISLAVAFYIDIYMSDLFNTENEIIDIFILYALIYREEFNVFKYTSFFETYLKYKDEFRMCLLEASRNWSEGFSNINLLRNLVIRMLLDEYHQIDSKIKALEIINKNNKTDQVENTIMKRLPQTFTKQMIIERHPTVSSETIDRTLKRLRMENKIRPNGTGRSASWNRLVEIEHFSPSKTQISLFDVIDDKEE